MAIKMLFNKERLTQYLYGPKSDLGLKTGLFSLATRASSGFGQCGAPK
jgi:hypothetical protein